MSQREVCKYSLFLFRISFPKSPSVNISYANVMCIILAILYNFYRAKMNLLHTLHAKHPPFQSFEYIHVFP